MSDYPMLISNKLHSFRNFYVTNIHKIMRKTERLIEITVCLLYNGKHDY